MRENRERGVASVAKKREDEASRILNAIIIHSAIALVIAAYILTVD